jgi:hypothetical protein
VPLAVAEEISRLIEGDLKGLCSTIPGELWRDGAEQERQTSASLP